MPPITTGSSVLAIKYADGVMIAADTLVSYGSLARFKNESRLKKVSENCILAFTGDHSDFQYISEMIEDEIERDRFIDDGVVRSPAEIHSLLGRIMYHRRSKMEPLWDTLIVAGRDASGTFIGNTDLQGTVFSDDFMATGYGAYMALPIIRKKWRADMDQQAALGLLEECLKVLFFRDARSTANVQLAKVTADGVQITEPYRIDQEAYWEFGRQVVGI
ncbi:Proteasome, subunit alpha/beta [Carpediemonas membranifera]|uniref:Proteasome subunit beta n=1 Tax=Carpediemonas membranifera TaxID=201153 RepID=A0A8J6E018_9EUKA|nr:Proteasome, subunit alpha/beta [Carpediemonas membranifera]|eukprot:KAG9391196.1 Proteasome, subunit alpha/beta [Carpediemonas membranifera]